MEKNVYFHCANIWLLAAEKIVRVLFMFSKFISESYIYLLR